MSEATCTSAQSRRPQKLPPSREIKEATCTSAQSRSSNSPYSSLQVSKQLAQVHRAEALTYAPSLNQCREATCTSAQSRSVTGAEKSKSKLKQLAQVRRAEVAPRCQSLTVRRSNLHKCAEQKDFAVPRILKDAGSNLHKCAEQKDMSLVTACIRPSKQLAQVRRAEVF